MNSKGNSKTECVSLIFSKVMYNFTNVIVLHPPTSSFYRCTWINVLKWKFDLGLSKLFPWK